MYLITLALLVLEFNQNYAAEKPNIVIIVVDDMGRNDVGYSGSEIPTPNIDALAYSGIILDRHYSQPSCSPSRAALLTGKYPIRLGMQGAPLPVSVPYGLNPKEKIMPQHFKKLGYSTHLVGKWHVGYYTPAHLPTNRGFDSFMGFHNGFLGYYDGTHFDKNISGLDAWRGTTKVWHEFFGKYLTTLMTEEAVQVIDNHAAKDKTDGLFMIVASPAPHRGNRPLRLEPAPITFGQRTMNISDENRRFYADMMKGVDDMVGNIFTALTKNNMIKNTIVVFFSDNGAPTTDTLWNFENHGSNWPLKGEKMSLHEGGVRTAAVIWASSLTKSSSKIHNGLFHVIDWLPTLYSAAGGNVSDLNKIDGLNQWDALISGKHPRKDLLLDINDGNNAEAVIKGKWKLIRNYHPNDAFSFTDLYYGSSSKGIIEYNKTEIIFSQVGLSMGGGKLDEDSIERLRSKLTMDQYCDEQQQLKSSSHDCHSKYCLYNIEADPSECYDIATSNQNIVDNLSSLLDYCRRYLVKKPVYHLDEKGFPGVSNYWEPWITNPASTSVVSELMVLFTVCILTFFLTNSF